MKQKAIYFNKSKTKTPQKEFSLSNQMQLQNVRLTQQKK